ncbi:hypothetical protein JCM8547_008905 [Rhodosporidiobolus lusitaniae]
MSADAQVTVIDDSSPGPFEGPEKLLEIWFAPSEEDVQQRNLPLKGGRKGKERWTGLRQVEKSVWDSMLDEVCCKVLSVIEGEEVDAYLLSESSMFVWPHKLILKTCGTTTLLLGIPTLLRIASEVCGFKGVWRCFYSRKTFMFPDRQKGPHKDWSQEMAFLDKLFENSSAYTVGRMNGDHWLLYITPPSDDVLLPNALSSSVTMQPANPETPLSALSASLDTKPSAFPHNPAPSSSPSSSLLHKPRFSPHRPDQTLEIMMTQLSPAACQKFYHPSSSASSSYVTPLPADHPLVTGSEGDGDAHALGAKLSDDIGLTAILPGATMDSFLFAPCGYSMNAVRDDRYATVHVTPEEEYSYASFECNFDFDNLGGASTSTSKNNGSAGSVSSVEGDELEMDGVVSSRAPGGRRSESLQTLIERVLAIFEPSKVSMTLFVSDDELAGSSESEGAEAGKKERAHEGMRQLLNPRLLETYERVDRILYEFDGYALVYCVFQKKEKR